MNKNIQQKSSSSKYHPFSIPPSIDFCIQHRNCSQFGHILQQLSQQSCPCCNSPPRQNLPYCCNVSQIYEISQPAGYYFNYIKLITFALIAIMLIIGVYTLVEIVNQCNNEEDSQQGLCLYVYGIPIPKIHVFFKVPLIILNIIVIFALYGFSIYLFFRQTYLHQKNLCGFQRSSDYSIMLSGYNHDTIKLQDLRQILSGYQIKDIIFTHKIRKYLHWLSKKSLLDAQLIRYKQRGSNKVSKIQQQIKQLQNLMLHTKNKLLLGQDIQFRTDKVIITFSEAHHKKSFQQIYGLTMMKNIYHTFCGGSPLIINNHPVFIEPLGQPNQIIWQNFQITSRNRYLRVFASNLVTVLLLGGSFVMVAYLSKGEQDRSAVGDALMSIVFAILIQVVNQVLTFSIDIFTNWEGRYTMTGQISMKLYKNCAGFFLNTTLLPFMLFVLDLFQPEEDDIIRNILSIFFISNLVSPYVGLILQPKYLLKLYRRRKIRNQGTQCLTTQKKANQIFQKIDFMLDQRYALISQLVMNCMFYAAIFPIGIVITIIGMIITYWSSKWWILNYSSVPKFSYRLSQHINIISCFYPTIYAFGYAANIYMVPKQVQFNRTYSIYIAIATIPISLFIILFGDTIAKKCITKYRKSISQCINITKHKFIYSYKSLNPTTFFHQNLSIKNQQKPGDIWNKLVSYVAAKQSGIIINQDLYQNQENLSRRSSSIRSSKMSVTQQIN